jgi:hypothetical protein
MTSIKIILENSDYDIEQWGCMRGILIVAIFESVEVRI